MQQVPLRNRAGDVVATTIVDDEDASLATSFRWSLARGYASRCVRLGGSKQRRLYLHREILRAPRGVQVDHVNGDKLDNRRSNLRSCSRAENSQNRHGLEFRGTTLSKATGKWLARVTINYKQHHLGSFDTQEEAARVAAAYREQHMSHSTN